MGSSASKMHGNGMLTWKVFRSATRTTSSPARWQRIGRRTASRCRACGRFESIGCANNDTALPKSSSRNKQLIQHRAARQNLFPLHALDEVIYPSIQRTGPFSSQVDQVAVIVIDL